MPLPRYSGRNNARLRGQNENMVIIMRKMLFGIRKIEHRKQKTGEML